MKIAMPKNGEMINQHFGQSKSFLIAAIENQQVVKTQEISSESMQHNHAGLSGLFFIRRGIPGYYWRHRETSAGCAKRKRAGGYQRSFWQM